MAFQNQKVKPRQTATPTTQTKDLGIVSEVPMDEWNATTPYQKLNKVRYVSTGGSGVTLLAKKQNQGVEPFVSQGWKEVWMVETYDGGAVIPNGTYPNMTVGNATNAQNDGNGVNIVEQFSDINEKIPSSASAENQIATEAFVNSSVNNSSAFYITYTRGTTTTAGQAFPTTASLLNATTFYSGKDERVPTQNDYATVLADETKPKGVDGTYPTTRYVYQGGTYPNGQWAFQYVVNNTSLTQAQVDAINSGITKSLVGKIDDNADAIELETLDRIDADDNLQQQIDELNAGSVTSVNGKAGTVVLNAEDVGAAAESALTDGSVTKVGTSTKGSSTKPIYLSSGTPTECSRTIPSITLNGSSNTSPSFYAPTSAGTNGYLSKSNGSGAPSWASHGSYSGSGLTSHAGVADYVKEYYHTTSGSAWYRIWASGWKEMGGLIAGDSSNPATHIISLPAPFTTTNYAVFFSVIKENTNVTMEVGQIFNRTKSQMTVQILYRNASSSGYASEACLWYACGY